MSEEKRQYPRVALTVEDGYFGTFRLADENTLVAPILSLSAGGLMLALAEAKLEQIEVGDRMHLKHLSGTVQLNFLSDIDVTVRWIEDTESPDYKSVGCELLDLSDSLREQVTKFVDIERKSRGQYR